MTEARPLKVTDVAEHILAKLAPAGSRGYVSSWKLQKLVYYCQAWSLVWYEHRLFEEPIEAWQDGPVVRRLYDHHRGKYALRSGDIDSNASEIESSTARATIAAVLDHYGDMNGQALRDRTHREFPWIQARAGVPPSERGGVEISPETLIDYYGQS